MFGHTKPLLVIVELVRTDREPEPETVILADSVTEPLADNPAVIVRLPVKPVQLNDRQALVTLTVRLIAPDAAVRNTASATVGNENPPAPPSVSDQLVVEFQLPVPPPTRYLFAIIVPPHTMFEPIHHLHQELSTFLQV